MPQEDSTAVSLLRPDDVITLSRELQAMISAGVPIDLGLRNSIGSFPGELDLVARHLAERLAGGASLSAALSDEKALPPVFRAALVAGLACGRSQEVLQDVAVSSQQVRNLRQALQLGMIYPTIVVYLALALFGVILLSLVPRIEGVYLHLFQEVPPLIALGAQWQPSPLLFVGLLLAFGGTMFLLTRGSRGPLLHGLGWVPGIRRLREDLELAQLTHLLALLVKYDLPLPEALELSGEAVERPRLQSQVNELANAIRQGATLDASLERLSEIPSFLRWLLIAGSQHSELGETLQIAAEYHRSRAERRALWITEVFPITVVALLGGGVTLLYCLTIILPVVQLWQQMGG